MKHSLRPPTLFFFRLPPRLSSLPTSICLPPISWVFLTSFLFSFPTTFIQFYSNRRHNIQISFDVFIIVNVKWQYFNSFSIFLLRLQNKVADPFRLPFHPWFRFVCEGFSFTFYTNFFSSVVVVTSFSSLRFLMVPGPVSSTRRTEYTRNKRLKYENPESFNLLFTGFTNNSGDQGIPRRSLWL